ncbi:MAG: hypothetical protein GX323_07645 [Clostridiales bacterium]|nr:hypothetical protein [Clostridiales bacterium]
MKQRKWTIKIVAIFLLAVLLSSLVPSVATAKTPYKTFTIDGYGNVNETQTSYLPHKTITKFGDESFSGPSDMHVTKDGEIYIADTENARIVVGNLEGELIKTIGEGDLITPKGVFVTDDKHVYVADRDAGAVYEFDPEGELLNTYTKPNNPLYGERLDFLPLKVVVNDAGIMFIVAESNTNGIVEISPLEGGSFLGYFGTNFASADLMTIIYRTILTDEQRGKMVSNVPSTPDNLAIDDKGLIYTVTRGDKENTLKKLNIAGTNLLGKTEYDRIPAAVAPGNHDNIYVASQQGYIYEYNGEGDLLYVFGGLDDGTQRVGLSTLVSAIQVDLEDRIYVLDTDKAQIQVYEPTEFTNLLHQALYLYSNGRYTESKEPLTEILKMNSMFNYANQAIGRAYFQEENYELALSYAKLANDEEGYSDAFWEIRNLWLQENIVKLVGIVIGIWLVKKALKLIDDKKNIFSGYRRLKAKLGENEIISNLKYAKHYMYHPIDGSYGIARQNRASYIAPTIIVVIFAIEFIIDKYLRGFLQKTVPEGRYEVLSDLGMIAIVIFAITVCHYLVCTINEGEGTVKKIYTFLAYSLMPYILFVPIRFVLTHVLTLNEQFLITMITFLMVGWVIVIGVIGIKEVNNYTPKETFKVICLTIFTILIMALILFVLYVLWAQVFGFITEVIGEVVYRIVE